MTGFAKRTPLTSEDSYLPMLTSSDIEPMIEAITLGDLKICELLIKNGADINFQNKGRYLTALHLASEKGHIEICELLIKNGADVNSTAYTFGRTPLHLASEKGHTEICELLIKHGSNVNAQERFTQKYTPLFEAAYFNHIDTCELLLKNGARIDFEYGRDDNTLLHMLSFINLNIKKKKICELLINYGADVNAKNYYDQTPLHLSFLNSNFDICELLIDYGANVNASDIDGRKPLDIVFESETKTHYQKHLKEYIIYNRRKKLLLFL